MSTLSFFRWEYRMNRRLHGPIVSVLIALRTACKPTPF